MTCLLSGKDLMLRQNKGQMCFRIVYIYILYSPLSYILLGPWVFNHVQAMPSLEKHVYIKRFMEFVLLDTRKAIHMQDLIPWFPKK